MPLTMECFWAGILLCKCECCWAGSACWVVEELDRECCSVGVLLGRECCWVVEVLGRECCWVGVLLAGSAFGHGACRKEMLLVKRKYLHVKI